MSYPDGAPANDAAITVISEAEQVASRTRELYASYAENQPATLAEPERSTSPRRRPRSRRSRDATPAHASTHDEIALLAYQLYEQAGCPPERGVEFWLEAERQLATARER